MSPKMLAPDTKLFGITSQNADLCICLLESLGLWSQTLPKCHVTMSSFAEMLIVNRS